MAKTASIGLDIAPGNCRGVFGGVVGGASPIFPCPTSAKAEYSHALAGPNGATCLVQSGVLAPTHELDSGSPPRRRSTARISGERRSKSHPATPAAGRDQNAQIKKFHQGAKIGSARK
jgi:hypothetical protein